MPTNKIITLDNLTTYDTLIKEKIEALKPLLGNSAPDSQTEANIEGQLYVDYSAPALYFEYYDQGQQNWVKLAKYSDIVADTNQKVKAGAVTFGDNDVINFVGSGIVTVTGDASDDSITISASHQSIKKLDTTATTGQSTSASEDITGSGTIVLHKVSKTGSYTDLLDKPTIPTVNNATLTIQKNNTTVSTFTANASSNVTANITVPTSDSDLTNNRYVRYDVNSQSLTDTQKSNARTNIGAGTSSFSGSYNDLTDKPTLGDAASKGVATSISSSSTDNDLATALAVYTAISNLPEPMIFKGSLGTGGTITTLPTASASNEGWTYKVITAGTYAGQAAKVGDTFISDGTAWVLIPSGDEPSGTVTSVGLTVPTGLSVSGSPITSSGTLAISLASGYVIPTQTTLNGKQDVLTPGDNISIVTSGSTNTIDVTNYATSTDISNLFSTT